MSEKVSVLNKTIDEKFLELKSIRLHFRNYDMRMIYGTTEDTEIDLGNVGNVFTFSITKKKENLDETEEKVMSEFYKLMRGVCNELFGD